MLLFGIKALPLDKRKNRLDGALGGFLDLFGDRVLPFDTDAARHYAELAVTAKTGGWGLPTPDGYIAAIAAANGFTVASRDTGGGGRDRHQPLAGVEDDYESIGALKLRLLQARATWVKVGIGAGNTVDSESFLDGLKTGQYD